MGFTAEIPALYFNKSETAYWRQIRRVSPSWRKRDQALQQSLEKMLADGTLGKEAGKDLSSQVSVLVVGDSLDERTGRIGVPGPFAALTTKVTATLSAMLPGLAMKTG